MGVLVVQEFRTWHQVIESIEAGLLRVEDHFQVTRDGAVLALAAIEPTRFVYVNTATGVATVEYFAPLPARGDGAAPAPAPAPARERTLPTDSAERKEIPIAEGVLFYFPAALAEVAQVSKAGNDKHNPGQPLHHARGKSMDHEDCVIRHTIDAREATGAARTRELAERAWRALAALQEHCETEGAPLAPNAKVTT